MGDKSFEQLKEADFFYQPTSESNSIAILIQHMYGNMMSRFTNFLTKDGEKEWRKRDAEFEAMELSANDLLSFWNTGWNLAMSTIASLTEADYEKTVLIRSEPITVPDALLRQLAHYSTHVGQIMYIGKMIKNETWVSLSLPKAKK